MKTWLLVIVGAIACALLVSSIVLTRPAFDAMLEGEPFDGISMLPLEQGLTFARVVSGTSPTLVIVRRVSAEGLHVVDIGAATSRP